MAGLPAGKRLLGVLLAGVGVIGALAAAYVGTAAAWVVFLEVLAFLAVAAAAGMASPSFEDLSGTPRKTGQSSCSDSEDARS